MAGARAAQKTDPRIRRTRALVVQAFEEVMGEKGFHALSVQDVAMKAGINRATFYDHFKDKYELLNYSIRLEFDHELDKRRLKEEVVSANALQRLLIAVCEFISRIHAHCKPPLDQLDSLVETQVKEVMSELLAGWLRGNGSGAKSRRTRAGELPAKAASWALYGLALHWAREERPQPIETFASSAVPLVSGILGQLTARESRRSGESRRGGRNASRHR
jgi:AcrR family transcriptional regulator